MTPLELQKCVTASPLNQSRIAKELGIAPTTLGRWIKGERKIGPTDEKLLRLYFFEEMPFRVAGPSEDLRNILRFTPQEWEVITVLAKRQGFIDPRSWITAQIRGHLEHNPEARRETALRSGDSFDRKLAEIMTPKKKETPREGSAS